MTPLLTDDERDAVAQLGDVFDQMCKCVIGHGRSRAADIQETAGHIHALQNMILAQAAARAYPDAYRLMGEMRVET